MGNAHLIAILTDFGTSDPFTGIMKGVISGIAPGIPILDLTHEIPPGDIQRAALHLWQARPYFPAATVFLGVVDPGVGTSRRPVRVDSMGQTFIGPDNGLFSFVFSNNFQAWELRNESLALHNPGATFHGRDIFAPAAAYSAIGTSGLEFGPACNDLIRLPSPRLEAPAPGELRGEILFPDRFGNLLTSLGRFVPSGEGIYKLDSWIEGGGSALFPMKETQTLRFEAASTRLYLPHGASLPWVKTFSEAPPGNCAFLVGSSGLLEIVANRQDAAALLNLERGVEITLRSQGEPEHG